MSEAHDMPMSDEQQREAADRFAPPMPPPEPPPRPVPRQVPRAAPAGPFGLREEIRRTLVDLVVAQRGELRQEAAALRAEIAELKALRTGPPGRSMTVRGTWDAADTYQGLDVVALNGASFVALRDDPGPCPGPGWQLVAAQGGRGKAGTIARADASPAGLLTFTNADGSRVSVDLAPMVAALMARAR